MQKSRIISIVVSHLPCYKCIALLKNLRILYVRDRYMCDRINPPPPYHFGCAIVLIAGTIGFSTILNSGIVTGLYLWSLPRGVGYKRGFIFTPPRRKKFPNGRAIKEKKNFFERKKVWTNKRFWRPLSSRGNGHQKKKKCGFLSCLPCQN